MIRFAVLLFFSSALFATTLVKHNLYSASNRIDLMLTFDTPYSGKISKTQNKMGIILLLENIHFPEKRFTQKFDSDIIDALTIAVMDKKILIELKSSHEIQVNASKTIDNMGLRIRIQKANSAVQEKEVLRPIATPFENKRTDDYSFSFAFLKIMLVLGGLIVALWLLKKWLDKRSGTAWLFGEKQESDNIKIVLQKPIDMKNRVVLLTYEKKKYLLLLGENNLLLDRIEDKEAAFETLLQKNGKKLGDYLEK